MSSSNKKEIELHTIRRLNLLTLYREFASKRLSSTGDASGTDAAFAAHIQVSPSMLSQIKTHRSIGNKVARQIEAALELDSGWLDIERNSMPVITSQQLKFEKLARRLWSEGTAKQKREALTALIEVLS
jgi:DNA repair protein RadC